MHKGFPSHGSVTAGHACAPHARLEGKHLKILWPENDRCHGNLTTLSLSVAAFFCFPFCFFFKRRLSRGHGRGTKTTCFSTCPPYTSRTPYVPHETTARPLARIRVCVCVYHEWPLKAVMFVRTVSGNTLCFSTRFPRPRGRANRQKPKIILFFHFRIGERPTVVQEIV